MLVTGTATPGSAVRIEVGGKEATTYHVGESGKFLVLAFLAPGENQIEAIATKDGGKTSVKATITSGTVHP